MVVTNYEVLTNTHDNAEGNIDRGENEIHQIPGIELLAHVDLIDGIITNGMVHFHDFC